jgi:hypothetical protein
MVCSCRLWMGSVLKDSQSGHTEHRSRNELVRHYRCRSAEPCTQSPTRIWFSPIANDSTSSTSLTPSRRSLGEPTPVSRNRLQHLPVPSQLAQSSRQSRLPPNGNRHALPSQQSRDTHHSEFPTQPRTLNRLSLVDHASDASLSS